MSNTNIRAAEPRDIDVVIELCRLHAIHEQAEVSEEQLNETSLKQLLFSSDAPVTCLVAELEGTVVGYVTFNPQFSTWHAGKYMYLDCLYLIESARGKGLGRELMQCVREKARKAGCDHVQWQTPTFNSQAIECYQRMGAVARPKQRFRWPVESNNAEEIKLKILGPTESLSNPYRPRPTRFTEVRDLNGWKLKIYQITLDGRPIANKVVEAAIDCISIRSIWPVGIEHQYGVVILHQGEQAVWALLQVWVNDILRQFIFFAPLDDATSFDVSPMPGFNECVWELEVTMHERDAWVRHVMANPDNPRFDDYLNDSIRIERSEKQTT